MELLEYPLEDLLVKLSLYNSIEFDTIDRDIKYLFQLFYQEKTLDTFCVECNRLSTFHKPSNFPVYAVQPPGAKPTYAVEASTYNAFKQNLDEASFFISKIISVDLVCSRDHNHKIYLFYRTHHGLLTKIGQYPSIADLSKPDLRTYRKALSSSMFNELNKGVGLFAHGIGIGSFIYLRRVFEHLIFEAYSIAKTKPDWNESDYEKGRISERIDQLKDYLPSFLVKNKQLYAIMSKGIHELSEEECLSLFPIILTGIELILDDKIELINKSVKIAEAEKAIASIANKLKG